MSWQVLVVTEDQKLIYQIIIYFPHYCTHINIYESDNYSQNKLKITFKVKCKSLDTREGLHSATGREREKCKTFY